MNSQKKVFGAVLAAGLGTRLRPLTESMPKPLVPMAGRPLIEYALDALAAAGIEEIGVNAFHHGDVIPNLLSHRTEEIHYVFETELKGTGGGLKGIGQRLPEGTIVAVNGDALFDFSIMPFIERHRARGAQATLVLRRVPTGSPFGRVGSADDGQIHVISEVRGPEAQEHSLSFGAYTGVQIFESSLLDLVPDEPCDILRTAHRQLLEQKIPVFGDYAPDESVWIDVGTPDRYLEAHRGFMDGRLNTRHLPEADAEGRRISADASIGSGTQLSGPCVIMPGATIEAGCRIGPHTFVGRDARVGQGVSLNECVVWSGVAVHENGDKRVFYRR